MHHGKGYPFSRPVPRLNIFVVTHKGEPYAPIKPIVEDMGLTWEAQARKLRDNRDRWGMINMIIPSASGNQDTLCMPVRKLPAFFASINPNKVRSELRDRIRLYQDECDDALWNYWTKGQATRRPKAALPRVPQPTTAGADSRRAGTLPYLPTGVLQGRFRTGTLPARCLLDARQHHAGQPEAVRKRHELRHPVPFSATCHTMEAMERYASAHIAGEELMRRGAQ